MELGQRRYTTESTGATKVLAETSLRAIYVACGAVIKVTDLRSTVIEGDVRQVLDYYWVAGAYEPRLEELEQGLAALQDRIDALEQEVSDGAPAESSSIDPDLFAKIIRACLADDRITEDEEETIITALR